MIKMKKYLLRLSLAIALVISCNLVSAQLQYTPYDDLPTIIKSYKPAYSDDFPAWAKMLYQYPINFNELEKEFDSFNFGNEYSKSPIMRYYKIWKRAIYQYVLDNGTIILPDLTDYYNELYKSQLTAGTESKSGIRSNSDWTFLGPKETFWLNESGSGTPPDACPWQVNIYSFDVSATNDNIIFCGTETGFVNKSVDQGFTWQLVAPDYLFGGAVTAIAIHPGSSEIIYAAAGNQVHKSTDGGDSWIPLLENDELFYADRLKIDLNNTDKLIAASNNGIYISIDGGLSWENRWDKPSWDVEIKPDDSDVIFALTKLNGNFSLVMSVDGGLNFEVQPTFPSDIAEQSGGLLAVTVANPEMLLVVMLSSDNTPYLYKGVFVSNVWNWSLLAEGQTGSFPMDNGQGYFDLVLEISPDNENIVFAGTTTLFKSANGGQSFIAIGGYYGNFSIHPDIQDMKILTNGETWVSTDGGISFSTDNFTNTANYFSRNNGMIGSDMWGFDQGWNEDLVVGGRYHNGNTAIADFYQPKALRMGGAESPTGWVLQGKSRHVAFNDLGNGWILPQTAEEAPEGRFIFSKYPNMDEYGGRRGNMVFHPNYYGEIYLGEGNGFWKSIDMGLTYDLLYDFNNRVRYLQISYSNPDVIYADVVGKGLYKSQDGGVSWELKPSLTSGQYGTSYWKGKLFIAISPYNENIIYTCLQNGTWSEDIGKVFRSADGGDSWEDWTGSLNEYTKCLVIQPAENEQNMVYLFTNATNGQTSKVYVRDEGMSDWESFDDNYPVCTNVNIALPFYRDSKLRVAGNGGVWESPMDDMQYEPIINPWIEKAFYNCMLDTLYFDDHSIIDHEGVTWQWEISPEPEFIDNPNIRNPKVVLGYPGTFSVTLNVTKNGNTYSKYIADMVTTTTCPSIEDCDNPAELPKDIWELVYVDSEETNYPGLATMSFDDDPSTIWHTRWSSGTDPYPHEIQVDLGDIYKIFKFTYLNRQDGQNGRIKEYELYFSEDQQEWGEPVSQGEFENTSAPQTIVLDSAVIGHYFKLLALSEVNENAWASAAEFSIVGCTDITDNKDKFDCSNNITAFPVPTTGVVNISLPESKRLDYRIISINGRLIKQGVIDNPSVSYTFDLGLNKPGIYFIYLINEQGISYRVKLIKQ